MGKQVQHRRGTTAQHATFTGAIGEVTVDTDKDVVVVHDGVTVGGFPHLSQALFDQQLPFRIVSDIATLRSTPVTTVNNVELRYYSTLGDGGGGFFYGATGGSYTDNGGTIITTGLGVTAASAWIRVHTQATPQGAEAGPVSVRWFGAQGNGSTDDTAAIQRALTYSRNVRIPAGRYVVSSTLTAGYGAQIIGDGPEVTLLQRTANYSDTISFASAGAARVSGIWFYKPQSVSPPAPPASITYPVVSGSCHIRMAYGTGAIIDNCYFNLMPYGVIIQNCSITKIEFCRFTGLWDPANAAAQESIASIYLQSGGTYNVTIWIKNNNIAGGYSDATGRTTTIGSVTYSSGGFTLGGKYGIFCEAAEDLYITDNYFGGQTINCIYFVREQIINGIKIEANFFDSALEEMIYTNGSATSSGAPYTPLVGMVIADNHFNGQGFGKYCIRFNDPASNISATCVIVANNNFEKMAGCPIIATGVRGLTLTNNNFSAYNNPAGAVGSPTYNTTAEFASAVYVAGSSSYVSGSGNRYGGAADFLSAVNNCKWGIYFAGSLGANLGTCSASDERVYGGLGLAGGAVVAGVEQTYPTERAVTAPTLLNSWVNYGGGTTEAGYWKDDYGVVHLQGFVKNGSGLSTIVFQLPTGYRPALQINFSTVSNNAFGYGSVNADGNVYAVGGSTTSFSLDGISFKAG